MRCTVIAEAKEEVYKEVAAWDRRRREAEARSEEFTEPLPSHESEDQKS